jgi:hypothetical protein
MEHQPGSSAGSMPSQVSPEDFAACSIGNIRHRSLAAFLLPSNVWHHDVIASRPKLPERETPQAFAAQSRGNGWSSKPATRIFLTIEQLCVTSRDTGTLTRYTLFTGGFAMQRSLLALALIATASVSTASASYAQMAPQPGYAPQPAYSQTRPTNEPLDPYGHPLIGRNDWVAQPGDRTNAGAAPRIPNNNATMNSDMAQTPSGAMPMQSGPHQTAFRDEYGFRYDAQGNRLDARGNIISPQTR